MKTRAITCAILMFIVPAAIGQVSTNFLYRFRFPLLNDSLRCDLGPLYAWWTAQLDVKTNLPPTGREGVGETNNATIGRPMAPWFHITGEIVNKDEPQGWIVNAMVETAPGKGTPMRIILIHPPRKEPGRFAERMYFLNNPPPPPDYSSQEAEIQVWNNSAFVADSLGALDVGDMYAAAAEEARRKLEDQKSLDRSMAEKMEQGLIALGNFPPDWEAYRVDLFAYNTGRQIKGLPAFDAGLSFSN